VQHLPRVCASTWILNPCNVSHGNLLKPQWSLTKIGVEWMGAYKHKSQRLEWRGGGGHKAFLSLKFPQPSQRVGATRYRQRPKIRPLDENTMCLEFRKTYLEVLTCIRTVRMKKNTFPRSSSNVPWGTEPSRNISGATTPLRYWAWTVRGSGSQASLSSKDTSCSSTGKNFNRKFWT
jgi:hypothetical protein